MDAEFKFCRNCGAKISRSAKFCRSCGIKFEEQNDAAPPAKKQVAPAASAPDPSKVQASTQPGETAVLEFFTESVVKRPVAAMNGGAQIMGSVTEVPEIKSAFSTIGGSILSTLGGSLSLIIKPKYLFLAIIMAATWIGLDAFKDSNSELVNFLSWLTFAKGGFNREGIGTLGGIVGKSVVGVTLCSFFTGGIPKVFKGLGAVFTRTNGKRSILALISGFFTGIIGYFSFVGLDASDISTSMAGISGALLSLEALGGRSGMLYDIAESLTAKKTDGIRMPQEGKSNSLLTGLSLGFLLITLLTSITA